MLTQKIREKIVKKSMSLEKFGLNDLVWKKEDAKDLILAIMKDPIGILGGDVYKLQSTHLEPLYDNWSCEPINEESEEEYYIRSKIESLDYIENYSDKDMDKIVFSMTFTEKMI